MAVIGYTRVSTAEQGASGLGLDDQRAVIGAEAGRRGWAVEWVSDTGSGGDLRRPGLTAALAGIGTGDVLMVAKLDRLSRSLLDFAGLMARAQAEGWALVCLDLGVDTSSPAGEMVAAVMASFAQYERRVIGARTKDALAQLRQRGARLGRPVTLAPATAQRVQAMRKEGMTCAAIADQLNRWGVPAAQGGQWWPATVSKTLRSLALDREAALQRAHSTAPVVGASVSTIRR
ncbi:MAG: recombinase family protein [Actinomycetota bacterium]|nr:recombinase family protein [Actinomycetota bacterium]